MRPMTVLLVAMLGSLPALATGQDGNAPDRKAAVPKAPMAISLDLSSFVGKDSKPTIAAIIGVETPSSETKTPADKRTEKCDVQMSVYGASADKPVASQKISVGVSLDADEIAYDVFGRVAVPPGHYTVQVVVKTTGDRTGTAGAEIDVPDFARDRLSASGLMLRALARRPASPGVTYA